MKRIIILVLGIALLLSACQALNGNEAISARVSAAAAVPGGFARAEGPRDLRFPEDFGPHLDYQTEWWYYTGNLETVTGDHFGYQLTFFRRGLLPAQAHLERSSSWAAEQVYMAHFAITDVAGGVHSSFERFARGAAGLAGAQAEPYKVWLEDWQVVQRQPGVYRLFASGEGVAIDLALKDVKGAVLHGNQGYSQKGPDPGNASYYFSQTRLSSSGEITLGDDIYIVDGLSWMDHEFSTSTLSAGQVGWDWFSMQLDDGTDIMIFQIRRSDGGFDQFSSGTLVEPDGSAHPLYSGDFQIQVEATWRSLETDAVYPSRWIVRVPEFDLDLIIEPYLPDQEMQVSFVYWEGAVRIDGESAGRQVGGVGYVELTGYAESMEGGF